MFGDLDDPDQQFKRGLLMPVVGVVFHVVYVSWGKDCHPRWENLIQIMYGYLHTNIYVLLFATCTKLFATARDHCRKQSIKRQSYGTQP